MRVLIVHLSDMHINGPHDAVLKRAERIADAVNSRRVTAEHCVVVFTGDIAQAGRSEQYAIAGRFLRDITDGIDCPTTLAVIPGNHDCDLRPPQDARDVLIQSVRNEPQKEVPQGIVHQCAAVQQAFLSFRDEFASTHLHDLASPLYYEYRIPVGAECVVVRCFNTAWMSQVHEKPGQLVYPAGYADCSALGNLVIAAFHHPYHWQAPAALRPFQRLVEQHSHVVLTGHEHEYDRQNVHRPALNKTTAYLEASALQETGNPSTSAFNILLADTSDSKVVIFHFEWVRDMYHPSAKDERWEEAPLRPLGVGATFLSTPEFQEWLDDLEIPNASDDGVRRLLSDVYIFPDLMEAVRDVSLKQKRRTIKSENVISTIMRLPLTFISAPPKGGRTAFAKTLYGVFQDLGYVPIYVDARERGIRLDSVSNPALGPEIKQQYGDSAIERYKQLSKERRVILVDNIDALRSPTNATIKVLTMFAQYAAHVVVFGDDTAGRVSELNPPFASSDTANAFEIVPFNHALRERFARRWLSVGSDSDFEDTENSALLHKSVGILDAVIGRNYVPAFPIYLISLLTATQRGVVVDSNVRTHGYFYALLIHNALAGDGQTKDIDIRLSFLRALAYSMFEFAKTTFLRSEVRDCYDQFQKRHIIGRLDYNSLLADLIDRGILVAEDDAVRFRYAYLYNYFVAEYFSRHISEPEVRQHIGRLTASLSSENSSDILLFTVHLCSDRYIIDKMLEVASSFYSDAEPATLNAALQNVSKSDLSVTYVQKTTLESRQDLAEAKDTDIEATNDFESIEKRREESRDTISAALHTLKIAGQILKNFPGTLDGEAKVALTNACCLLGRRCLTVVLQNASSENRRILESAVAAIREAEPGVPMDKATAWAKDYLWYVTVISSYGLLRILTRSLAAPDLEPVYDLTLGADGGIMNRLIKASLQVDISNQFPADLVSRLADEVKHKPLPKMMLRGLALERFAQVYIPPRTRQRVCAKLDIKYQAQVALPRG